MAELHSRAVDYVKSGWPAEMPKRLRPRKWPHFMEKRHKESSTYHSVKILGQLYDKIETVGFVPEYTTPFDNRILEAYKLDGTILSSARDLKSQYDTAIRRVMSQHEIETEFEIWSAFVLSKPRVGSDYKVQEEVGRISESLKDRFRAVCIQQAGGDTFSILAPFVAAMYQVTKEEVDTALSECRSLKKVGGRELPIRKMDHKHMPLVSFPWLFDRELGKIAVNKVGAKEPADVEPTVLAQNDQAYHSNSGQLEDLSGVQGSKPYIHPNVTHIVDGHFEDQQKLEYIDSGIYQIPDSIESDSKSKDSKEQIKDALGSLNECKENKDLTNEHIQPLTTVIDSDCVVLKAISASISWPSRASGLTPADSKLEYSHKLSSDDTVIEEAVAEGSEESSLDKLARLLSS